MKKLFKGMSVMLILCMMVAFLPGCGKSKTPYATDVDPATCTEISVMVYDRGADYPEGYSVTNNKLTTFINEAMEPQGVHVNFVPVARSGADVRVNLMLAAGTAPDVIRTYDAQRVSDYAQKGGLCDLTDYVDQLDPYYLEANEEVIKMVQIDGKQFALPGVWSYHGKSHEMYIRQDLVEGVGKKLPTNREELIDVLYAIKDKYPDIVPYGFSGEMSAVNYTLFLLSYTSRSDERINYQYEPTYTIVLKPGHKEGLKQLNQMYLDGLIEQDFAQDTNGSSYNKNVANGKYAFITDNGSESMDAYKTAEDPNYHMVELDCLPDADGSYLVPSNDAFSHFIYVPKASEKRIDAIVKYLAWLTNEENALNVRFDILGVGSEVVDGVPIAKTGSERLKMGLAGSPNDLNFFWTNFAIEYPGLVDSFCEERPYVPREVAQGKIDSQYSNYYDRSVITSVLKTDEYVPNLQKLIIEFVFKVISAPEGQFEATYEKEFKKLNDNHLQEVLEERGKWYDENIANK